MSYTKSIIVQGLRIDRSVSTEVSLSNIPDTGYLSSLDINTIESIISDLNWIITQSTGVITWGVENFMVDSDSQGSLCRDLDDVEIADIPTNTIRDLMIEVKNFKQQYQNTINLKNIIVQAFDSIKSNRNQYKRWTSSNLHYMININGINVFMTLESNDFNLSSNQYADQIHLT